MTRRALLLSSVVLLAALALLPLTAQEKGAQVKTQGPEIVAKLQGHADAVYAVAFSPDGKYVVTGSFDNTIKLWETATGKEIKTYGGPTGHQKMVISVAFSPDGQLIASGSADNTLKVWDVPLSAPLRTHKAAAETQAVALSPDGKKAAYGGKDGQVRIVNAADFKELAKCDGHRGPVTGLAFNANGQVLASVGADRTLRFWSVAKGEPLAVVGAHTAPANAVTVLPNNLACTVGDDGQLRSWQVPAAPTGKRFPDATGTLHALTLSADGNQLFVGGADKSVRHFNNAGQLVRAFAGADADVNTIAVNTNNTQIAAGTQSRRVVLWNAGDGKVLSSWLAHTAPVTATQFHPGNTQLMTAGADGIVKLWALPAHAARSVPHPDGVLASVPSPDGKKLITGSADKLLRVWNLTNLAMERQYAGHAGPVTAAALSPNGQLLVSGGADATIRFWNQASGKEANLLLGHTAPIASLAINAAGNQLLSASEDGTVKLWALPPVTPKSLAHPDQVTCLALTPDGSKALTGGADRQVRLWNLTSGAKERDFAGPTLAVRAVTMSRNGTTIAAAAADKTVCLWNVADGKLRHKVTLSVAAQAVAFSADNQTVFAGLDDGSVKFVKVADGKEARTLPAHKGAVAGLAVTPKGETLLTAGADGTVQLWSLPDAMPKVKLAAGVPVVALALSKDGTRLAAAGAKAVKVWALPDGKEMASWQVPAEVRDLGFSPDGTRLVLACADKLARVHEINGRPVESFPHEGAVHGAAFVDARRLVTAGADKVARLWTSGLLWQRTHQGPVRQALFTPKGDQVISTGDDKAIRLWNAADGKDVRTLQADEPLRHLGIFADATKLVSAGAKAVQVWDLTPPKAGAPAPKQPTATITTNSAVQALALSPNGLRVALALTEGKATVVRVHDPKTGRLLQELTDHAGPVASLAFLSDNRTLVTGSLDKTAKLLDVNVLADLPAHGAGPIAAQYHNTGTQLLTGGADKTVKVWDLTKGGVLKTFGPLAEPIRAVAYSRDYTQAAAAAGKVVKVWNLADGKVLATLTHPANVTALSINADKTRIATGAEDKQTRLWDVPSGQQIQFVPHDDAVAAVVLAPNNTTVYSAAGKQSRFDGIAYARTVTASAGPVHALALAANNTHVLTGSADKTVKLWNVATGKEERSFAGATGPVRAVAAAKNGLLVAVGDDKAVRLYQYADGKAIGAAPVGAAVKVLSFTPNSLTVIASCADKTIRALGTPFVANQPLPKEFLRPVQTFAAPAVAADLAIAPDNATLYSVGLDSALHAWKLASPNPTRNFAHPNNVDAVAFDPTGKLLASGGHDGKVRLFDLVKGSQLKEINAHVKPPTPATVYTVAFSSDGKRLVSGSLDNSLKLWDVASGNMVKEFKAHKVKEFEKGHQEPVYSAAFSPDGKFLASGSSGLERSIKIWNLADGSVVRELSDAVYKAIPGLAGPAHPGAVYSLRFTKDGKYLLSAGDAPRNQGHLAVWNWQTGKLLHKETLPLGTFYHLALSPDERLLAIAAGNRGRPNPQFNVTYLLKMPALDK